MTPIRALFFLAAITAACAARIPTQVQETRSLETQIALLASHRLTGNPIENGIDKIKELVQKIQAKIQEAEAKLIQALEKSGTAVAKSINDFILKRTGVDLKLDEKLEALEKKNEVCLSQFQVNLKQVVADVKEDTETCAAKQVADVKEIVAKIQELVKVLEVVPQSIANIKQCAVDPAPAPEPEPTTPEAQTDAPTPAPETEAPVVALAVRKSNFWKTLKCVAKELSEVSKDLVEVPALLEKVVEDVKDLSSQENRQALESCALKAVSDKAPEVQTAAAQLAYCVIAPAQQ